MVGACAPVGCGREAEGEGIGGAGRRHGPGGKTGENRLQDHQISGKPMAERRCKPATPRAERRAVATAPPLVNLGAVAFRRQPALPQT